MSKEVNRHHLYPSSRWGLTNDVNCVMLDIKEHDNWHRVFVNSTCVEQLCKVLLMNKQVRSDRFIADLMDVLDNHLNNYYRCKVRSWFDRKEVKTVLSLEDNI